MKLLRSMTEIEQIRKSLEDIERESRQTLFEY